MTQTPPNRAARRASQKASQSRCHAHNQDLFTLRQRRIERERDERERTNDLIEKRKNDALREMKLHMNVEMSGGNEDGGVLQVGERHWLQETCPWLQDLIRHIKKGEVKLKCTWHIPAFGFLIGILVGAILRLMQTP